MFQGFSSIFNINPRCTNTNQFKQLSNFQHLRSFSTSSSMAKKLAAEDLTERCGKWTHWTQVDCDPNLQDRSWSICFPTGISQNWKISFGGIPNSSRYPNAMFDYMGPIFFAQWFCPCGQCHHQKVFKTITWLLLSRLQGDKPHRNSPEPAEPCLRGTYTSTHRNSPEPSSGTCSFGSATRTGTHQSLSGLKTPLAYAIREKQESHVRKIKVECPCFLIYIIFHPMACKNGVLLIWNQTLLVIEKPAGALLLKLLEDLIRLVIPAKPNTKQEILDLVPKCTKHIQAFFVFTYTMVKQETALWKHPPPPPPHWSDPLWGHPSENSNMFFWFFWGIGRSVWTSWSSDIPLHPRCNYHWTLAHWAISAFELQSKDLRQCLAVNAQSHLPRKMFLHLSGWWFDRCESILGWNTHCIYNVD